MAKLVMRYVVANKCMLLKVLWYRYHCLATDGTWLVVILHFPTFFFVGKCIDETNRAVLASTDDTFLLQDGLS